MSNDTVRSGVLIATQRRVTFDAKRLGGHEIESFACKNISSFESGKNIMGGSVTFYALNNRVRVRWINPPHAAQGFVKTVRDRMHEIQPAETSTSANASEDVFAKIQQLGSLRDSGVLTEEEFATKKTELLAQVRRRSKGTPKQQPQVPHNAELAGVVH